MSAAAPGRAQRWFWALATMAVCAAGALYCGAGGADPCRAHPQRTERSGQRDGAPHAEVFRAGAAPESVRWEAAAWSSATVNLTTG